MEVEEFRLSLGFCLGSILKKKIFFSSTTLHRPRLHMPNQLNIMRRPEVHYECYQ